MTSQQTSGIDQNGVFRREGPTCAFQMADGRRPAAAVAANKQNETGRSRHSRQTTRIRTMLFGGRSQHVHFARSAKCTADGGPVAARSRQTITIRMKGRSQLVRCARSAKFTAALVLHSTPIKAWGNCRIVAMLPLSLPGSSITEI